MRRLFLALLGGLFGLVLAVILCPPTLPDNWAFRAVVLSEPPSAPGQEGGNEAASASVAVSPETLSMVAADPSRDRRPSSAAVSPGVLALSAPDTTAADLAARLRERVRIPTNGVHWLERRLPIRTVSAHYRVHTDVSRGAAEETAAALEHLRDRLIERFGPADPSTLDGRFPVFVYSDRDVYTRGPAETEVAWPPGRSGFFDGRGNAHLLVLDDARAYLTLLTHEVAHQYHHAALGGGGPRWFKEGIAHAFEWRPARDLPPSPWPPSSESVDPLAAASPGVLGLLLASDPGVGVDEAMILRFLREADAGHFSLERALDAGSQPVAVDEASERAFGYVLIQYLQDARDGGFGPWYVEFERQVSAGGVAPTWPESAPKPRELLDEIRRFAVLCRPPTQVHFDLRWSDGRRTSARVEGELVTCPLGEAALETPARVCFAVDGFSGEERVGLAVLGEDGARETTWWIDHEGATLTTDDADGSRDVRMGVRVMFPFTMEFRLGATGGVRVLRSGMPMLDDPSFQLGEGRRLAIAFAAADDSAFQTTVALRGLDCAGLASAGADGAAAHGSGFDRAGIDRGGDPRDPSAGTHRTGVERSEPVETVGGVLPKGEKKRSPDPGL